MMVRWTLGTTHQIAWYKYKNKFTLYAQLKISLNLAGANKLTVLTNKTGTVYSAI